MGLLTAPSPAPFDLLRKSKENQVFEGFLRFCKRKCPGANGGWCQSVALLIQQLHTGFRLEKKVVIEIIAHAALKSCCGSFYERTGGGT